MREEKDGRRRKVPIIILLILALLLACAGGFMLWKSMQPDVDPGATIQQTEGKTTAEIQKELDKIANESRMTISVAPTVQLKDGRARHRRGQSAHGRNLCVDFASVHSGETEIEWL